MSRAMMRLLDLVDIYEFTYTLKKKFLFVDQLKVS